MADFDKELCRKRNRLAAKRDGVNATSFRLFRSDEEPASITELATSYGKLPKGDDAVLAAINSRRVGEEPLTVDRVWFRPAEACNDNFIADRWMFLDRSTLRNVASDADRGYAFMNSHRTGGMSHQTELPFGWTYGGRYEESEGRKRTLVGVYMILTNDKGEDLKPNGDSGPSCRDLASMIDSGAVPDVSVGLYGGDAVCDVCGEGLYAYDPDTYDYLCPHVPGTTYKMSVGEIKAQKARGVTDGCCSYSLVNARCGEVSSVYDGAVPGAGFRKALSLSREMDEACRLQAARSYHNLARSYDFSPKRGEDFREDGPISRPFEEHSQSVLTAVSELADRAEDYASLREGKGRPLSSERRAEFTRIHAALGRILTADGKPATGERILALRAFALRHDAEALGLGGAS